MIDAVFVFGVINILFEFVILAMIPCRIRLRILGRKSYQQVIHSLLLITMLMIHWGTLIGTMSGFLSFVLSMVTVEIAKVIFGYITPDNKFHRRIIGYTADELR